MTTSNFSISMGYTFSRLLIRFHGLRFILVLSYSHPLGIISSWTPLDLYNDHIPFVWLLCNALGTQLSMDILWLIDSVGSIHKKLVSWFGEPRESSRATPLVLGICPVFITDVIGRSLHSPCKQLALRCEAYFMLKSLSVLRQLCKGLLRVSDRQRRKQT